MALTGSTKEMNILVHLHKGGEKSWRYTVEKDQCSVDEVVTRSTSLPPERDLVSTMEWAVNKAPAENYALILWNHGTGVYDPEWGSPQPYYFKRPFGPMPGQQLRETQNLEQTGDVNKPYKLTRATTNLLDTERGILFDDELQTYLNNTQMRNAFLTIKNKVLKGKKLGLVGMDACLMGMVEVAYQIRDCANYFVSSQEFEFARGWSYGRLFQELNNKEVSSELFGKKIVTTFDDYYKTKTNFYTQSAVNMSYIELIKDNIDEIAKDIMACKEQDPTRVKKLITRARNYCLQFSTPDYIDLHSFVTELESLIEQVTQNNNSHEIKGLSPLPNLRVDKSLIEQLKYSLKTCAQLVKKAVVQNASGRHLARAEGISICFPHSFIDRSYIRSEFAKDSLWTDFVYDHLMN